MSWVAFGLHDNRRAHDHMSSHVTECGQSGSNATPWSHDRHKPFANVLLRKQFVVFFFGLLQLTENTEHIDLGHLTISYY